MRRAMDVEEKSDEMQKYPLHSLNHLEVTIEVDGYLLM